MQDGYSNDYPIAEAFVQTVLRVAGGSDGNERGDVAVHIIRGGDTGRRHALQPRNGSGYRGASCAGRGTQRRERGRQAPGRGAQVILSGVA